MTEKIIAPFTDEQVKLLNEYQQLGFVHEFTCCSEDIPECKRRNATMDRSEGKEVDYTPETNGTLIATTEGWICPCGKYKQNWAHEFMLAVEELKKANLDFMTKFDKK